MREIKLRAWDELNKEMVYPNFTFGMGGKTKSDILQQFENVMLCTGLKDKSGKDIYEGDIVKLDETPEIIKGTEFHSMEDVSHHEIYWDNERACYYDKRLEDGDSLAGYLDGDISFVSDCELVGNIYETPELVG